MFRTEIFPDPSEEKISLKDPIFLIGSCFSDHIGNYLKKFKFQVLTNPYGIIYNPYSIFKLLKLAISGKDIDTKGIICNQGIYRHFDLHSDISGNSEKQLTEKYNVAMEDTRQQLKRCRWIFITLGTAIVFRHTRYGDIVGNCHKIPGKEFDRFIMPPEDVIGNFEEFYTSLKGFNSDARIIITVSPVRHIKSTLEKNSVSKSVLRYAVDRICERYEEVQYFPSYEMVLDDLRDYRFFTKDMVHVNEITIDYVWQKLVKAYFDDSTREFLSEWEKISKALHHKPFRPESDEHQEFLRKTRDKILTFKKKIDITEEIKLLESQMYEQG